MNWSDVVSETADRSEIKKMSDFVNRTHDETVQEIINVCEIPAPSFHERQRADYVASRMKNFGCDEVSIDEHNNVIGRLKGMNSTAKLAVCAHIDTVFDSDVDVSVQKEEDTLRAPGVGDNSASVAGMLRMVAALEHAAYIPSCDLLFVGTACEEGLGDLNGIRGFLDGYCQSRDDVDLEGVLSLDGRMGGIVNVGIGSRRFEVTFTAEGGHSWGSFGSPSAVHIMGSSIHEINQIDVPTNPRTTYNVGVVQGGTSVNTIAENASMLVDMRSVGKMELERLEQKVRKIIETKARQGGGESEIEVVGDRPVGDISEEHPVVRIAHASGEQVGLSLSTKAASTDANIPLSRGIPSVTVGIYKGAGGHRKSEYMIPSSLKKGILMAILMTDGMLKWACGD